MQFNFAIFGLTQKNLSFLSFLSYPQNSVTVFMTAYDNFMTVFFINLSYTNLIFPCNRTQKNEHHDSQPDSQIRGNKRQAAKPLFVPD